MKTLWILILLASSLTWAQDTTSIINNMNISVTNMNNTINSANNTHSVEYCKSEDQPIVQLNHLGNQFIIESEDNPSAPLNSLFTTGWRYIFVEIKYGNSHLNSVNGAKMDPILNRLNPSLSYSKSLSEVISQIPCADINSAVLVVSTYDYNRWSRDNLIGHTEIAIPELVSSLLAGKPVKINAHPAALNITLRAGIVQR